MYPHPVEEWAQLRRLGPWRFIMAESLRAAITTALGLVVFGLSFVAVWAYRDGQALDFQWFQVGGQPGAESFHVYRHALMILPVGFLFSYVFWLVAGAKYWWLNERVHREALAAQGAPPVSKGSVACRPAALASLVTRAGATIFIAFFLYLPVANHWPALRLQAPWSELLYAAGLAGAGLVWSASSISWLVSVAQGLG